MGVCAALPKIFDTYSLFTTNFLKIETSFTDGNHTYVQYPRLNYVNGFFDSMEAIFENQHGSKYYGNFVHELSVVPPLASNPEIPCDVAEGVYAESDCATIERPWQVGFYFENILSTYLPMPSPFFFGHHNTKFVIGCDPHLLIGKYYIVNGTEENFHRFPEPRVETFRKKFPPGPKERVCKAPVAFLEMISSTSDGWYDPSKAFPLEYFVDNGSEIVQRGTLVNSMNDVEDIRLPNGQYTFRTPGFGDYNSALTASWVVHTKEGDSYPGDFSKSLTFEVDDCKFRFVNMTSLGFSLGNTLSSSSMKMLSDIDAVAHGAQVVTSSMQQQDTTLAIVTGIVVFVIMSIVMVFQRRPARANNFEALNTTVRGEVEATPKSKGAYSAVSKDVSPASFDGMFGDDA